MKTHLGKIEARVEACWRDHAPQNDRAENQTIKMDEVNMLLGCILFSLSYPFDIIRNHLKNRSFLYIQQNRRKEEKIKMSS